MPTGNEQLETIGTFSTCQNSNSPAEATPCGWVLYDDACGFCRKWVPYWEKTLRRRGFGIAPIQSAWVVEALALAGASLLTDIRLLLPDGRVVVGADVYRHVMRRIWWAYPVYLLSVIPLLRWCFDWAYRSFARNRYRFSKACGLPGKDPESADKADGL